MAKAQRITSMTARMKALTKIENAIKDQEKIADNASATKAEANAKIKRLHAARRELIEAKTDLLFDPDTGEVTNPDEPDPSDEGEGNDDE